MQSRFTAGSHQWNSLAIKSEPIYKSAQFPEHKIISIPNHKKIKWFIKDQILKDLEDDLDAWEELLKGGGGDMTRVKKRIDEILRLSYKRTLIPEDEGGYSALIEEFPGCYAQGETVQEAYANLEATAMAWLEANIEEGRDIPQPVAHEESVSGRLLLRLPKSLHRRSKVLAGRDGVSLNQFCVMAITEVVAKAEIGERSHAYEAIK